MKIKPKYFPGSEILATSISGVNEDQWMPDSKIRLATIK